MRLNEGMERNGDFLFRWRGYIPLIIVAPLLYVLASPEYVEVTFGEFAGHALEAISVGFVVAGLLLRVFTVGFVPKGTSGRNSKAQKADILNTSGFYSVTRNPLYLGNCLIYIGVLLFTQSPWLTLLGLFVMIFYYERIILREEQFLTKKFGDLYLAWVEKVPVFFPKLKGWKNPTLPFSWRSVLSREYPGLFYATLALFAVETIRGGLVESDWIETEWLLGFLIVTLFCACVRYLKKSTTYLQHEGR